MSINYLIFTDSALWAGSVTESQCPSVGVSVCLSIINAFFFKTSQSHWPTPVTWSLPRLLIALPRLTWSLLLKNSEELFIHGLHMKHEQTLGFKNQSLGFSFTDFGFTARQFLQAISWGKSEPSILRLSLGRVWSLPLDFPQASPQLHPLGFFLP